MLGNLLKHEFWATGRIFLPLYIAVLALGGIIGIMGLFNLPDLGIAAMSLWVFAIVGYVFALVAIFVVTFIVIVVRFYRNLLGQEGYLMFTLPVSRHQLILSKLITASAWHIATGIVASISVAIAIAAWISPEFWTNNMWLFEAAIAEFSRNFDQGGLMLAMYALSIPLSIVSSILTAYVAMAIGQLSNTGRIAVSIAAYFGISMLVGLISLIISWMVLLVTGQPMYGTFDLMDAGQTTAISLAVSNLLTLITCVAYYWGTEYLLRKRLNMV